MLWLVVTSGCSGIPWLWNIWKQRRRNSSLYWSSKAMLCKEEVRLFLVIHLPGHMPAWKQSKFYSLYRMTAFYYFVWDKKKNKNEEIITWVKMLYSVVKLSWPFLNFCAPAPAMTLSTLQLSRAPAVSSIAMLGLPISVQSVLLGLWGEELHSFIIGKLISTSAAGGTACCSFHGKAGVGLQKILFSAVLRKACLPSKPEGENRLHLKSFINNTLLKNGWRL